MTEIININEIRENKPLCVGMYSSAGRVFENLSGLSTLLKYFNITEESFNLFYEGLSQETKENKTKECLIMLYLSETRFYSQEKMIEIHVSKINERNLRDGSLNRYHLMVDVVDSKRIYHIIAITNNSKKIINIISKYFKHLPEELKPILNQELKEFIR